METDLKMGQLPNAVQRHPDLVMLWAKTRAELAGQFGAPAP
jgi:hypothetical protein